jgi:hypothetical protein
VTSTTDSDEDLAVLEQLDLDCNNADQASDAERLRTLLAEVAGRSSDQELTS